MILQEAADAVEMHVSTIRRITNGKYMQTPHEVFELKYFFGSKIDTANGEGVSFERAASIDLAGRDVLDAVKVSVNPKVINTPLIAAVAKDGIQVKATCRVTVRANIDRLVGGAGEETILARVGEGIVTTIASSSTHKQVLEDPARIS